MRAPRIWGVLPTLPKLATLRQSTLNLCHYRVIAAAPLAQFLSVKFHCRFKVHPISAEKQAAISGRLPCGYIVGGR
jgi:hypothetical protein